MNKQLAKKNQITKFERSMLDNFKTEVLAALTDYVEQRGLAVNGGSGTFSDTSYEFKIKFAIKAEGGEVLTYERKMFKQYATMYGLKPEWLDKSFIYNGQSYTIAGLNLKSRRYIVLCTSGHRFTANMVKNVMDPEGYAAEQKKIAEWNKAAAEQAKKGMAEEATTAGN